jgi:hypothetical protein
MPISQVYSIFRKDEDTAASMDDNWFRNAENAPRKTYANANLFVINPMSIGRKLIPEPES